MNKKIYWTKEGIKKNARPCLKEVYSSVNIEREVLKIVFLI